MQKVSFWTPVEDSRQHKATMIDNLFYMGGTYARYISCDHGGVGVMIESPSKKWVMVAFNLSSFAVSIFLSLRQLTSSKNLSKAHHLPSLALIGLFMAKVYYRSQIQYHVCPKDETNGLRPVVPPLQQAPYVAPTIDDLYGLVLQSRLLHTYVTEKSDPDQIISQMQKLQTNFLRGDGTYRSNANDSFFAILAKSGNEPRLILFITDNPYDYFPIWYVEKNSSTFTEKIVFLNHIGYQNVNPKRLLNEQDYNRLKQLITTGQAIGADGEKYELAF